MDMRKNYRNFFDHQMIPPSLESVLNFCKEAEEEVSFEENDYVAAKEVLSDALTPTEYSVLAETEELYTLMQKYATKHGFTSGVILGFVRYFSPKSSSYYDFKASVVDELFTLPGMDQHSEYKAWSAEYLKNLTDFEKTISAELYEHITSVECVWDQRIYSAALHSFGLGYHTAYGLIELRMPNKTV